MLTFIGYVKVGLCAHSSVSFIFYGFTEMKRYFPRDIYIANRREQISLKLSARAFGGSLASLGEFPGASF